MTRPAFFKYTNSIVTKGATEIARNWFFDVVVDDEEESLGCTTSSADGEDLIALVYRDEALVMGNEFETYIRASYPQVGDRPLSSIRRSSQGFIEVWFKPAMAEYWATYRTGRNTAGGFFEDFRIRGGYTADQWREVDEDVYQRAETALANYVPASRRKAWR